VFVNPNTSSGALTLTVCIERARFQLCRWCDKRIAWKPTLVLSGYWSQIDSPTLSCLWMRALQVKVQIKLPPLGRVGNFRLGCEYGKHNVPVLFIVWSSGGNFAWGCSIWI